MNKPSRDLLNIVITMKFEASGSLCKDAITQNSR